MHCFLLPETEGKCHGLPELQEHICTGGETAQSPFYRASRSLLSGLNAFMRGTACPADISSLLLLTPMPGSEGVAGEINKRHCHSTLFTAVQDPHDGLSAAHSGI